MQTNTGSQGNTTAQGLRDELVGLVDSEAGTAVHAKTAGGARALPLAAMGDVLHLFSDPESFRRRLDYIGDTLGIISRGWSRPEHPDPAATLGVLQELARNGVVPDGCEEIQETLLRAMGLYRQAAEGMHQAKLDAKPSECEEAWECVMQGHFLLGQAIKMATEG